MSEKAKGRKLTEAQKENLRQLRLGTKQPEEVVRKRTESMKNYAKNIEVFPHARLTKDDVFKILSLFDEGQKVPDIEHLFDVSRSSLYKIYRKESWKNVINQFEKLKEESQ